MNLLSIVQITVYLISINLLREKMFSIGYFKDGLRVNVHEFIPSFPDCRCLFPHSYLPVKNTDNSPLTFARGGRENGGIGSKKKKKNEERGREEGRKMYFSSFSSI